MPAKSKCPICGMKAWKYELQLYGDKCRECKLFHDVANSVPLESFEYKGKVWTLENLADDDGVFWLTYHGVYRFISRNPDKEVSIASFKNTIDFMCP